MNEYFKAPEKGSIRRRVAPLVLVVGLFSAFKLTFDVAPRKQRVHVHVPDRLRGQLSSVRLTYMEGSEPVSGSEQHFPSGAPGVLHSAPELSPGDYQLHVELSDKAGRITYSRHPVSVPSEGTLRIHLQSSP